MAHHCSSPSHHDSLSFILILTAHLCLDLSRGLLQFDLPTEPYKNTFFISSYCLVRSLTRSLTQSLTNSLTQYYELLYRFHA